MRHRVFELCLLFVILLAGTAQAGTDSSFESSSSSSSCKPEWKTCEFAKGYYIEDGGIVVRPPDHGFYYQHGVETPEGVRFKPGDTFATYDTQRHIEKVYWLMKVNWSNSRAYFHQQVYGYKVVKNRSGQYHKVRVAMLAKRDFSLTHYRGLVAWDHSFTNIEMHPGTQLWRNRQFAH